MSTPENLSPNSSDSTPLPQKNKKGSPLQSVAFLILILIALYYIKPYLTGENSIQSIDKMLSSMQPEQSASSEIKEAPLLKVPRISDRTLRPLLAEFKGCYELVHSQSYLGSSLPEVITIRYSEDNSQLLVEIESINPETQQLISEDIIFQTDSFGRLVTDGKYHSIKLHPKL